MGISVSLPTQRVRRGQPALSDVSFEFDLGLLAVVGPVDGGRSALLSILATVSSPPTGAVRILDCDLPREREAVRRRLGYVPQGAGLTPGLTLREALDFYLLLQSIRSPEERRERIRRVSDLFELEPSMETSTTGISGDLRYLACLAQACLMDAPLLIIEEPAELTQEQRQSARSVLASLAPSKTIVMAAEIVQDLDAVAQDVALLDGGRMTFFGPPDEFIRGAVGRTWEIEIPREEEVTFICGFVKTREEMTATGRRIRGVAMSPPAPNAQAVSPDFADAYAWRLASDEPVLSAAAAPSPLTQEMPAAAMRGHL